MLTISFVGQTSNKLYGFDLCLYLQEILMLRAYFGQNTVVSALPYISL